MIIYNFVKGMKKAGNDYLSFPTFSLITNKIGLYLQPFFLLSLLWLNSDRM